MCAREEQGGPPRRRWAGRWRLAAEYAAAWRPAGPHAGQRYLRGGRRGANRGV